jgi:L-serine dehydratase
MRAARLFAEALRERACIASVQRLQIDLFGSLGATGAGHRSDCAVILGLEGNRPESADPAEASAITARVRHERVLRLLGEHDVRFAQEADLRLRVEACPGRHPNAMVFQAFGADGALLERRAYDSVGGGTVAENGRGFDATVAAPREVAPFPYSSAAQLLHLCRHHGLSISELVMRNESTWRTEDVVRSELLRIWGVMQDCVRRGCHTGGVLPGRLRLRRRAPQLRRSVHGDSANPCADFFVEMDLVSLHAIAVAEENAAGGRVVTAPTNGSAGIVPAVLFYAMQTAERDSDDLAVDFLLAAAAVGALYKQNASISGAEVGCQGEIGVACSMAAAGLAHVLGGAPEHVETAAEIAMEHNLGLTCDPVAGLVQIPCIERNALGAVAAVAAARLALQASGEHLVSLDAVIETMQQTGHDMHDSYKETARGGLAAVVPRTYGCTVEC